MMRRALLPALFALAACATVPGNLPTLHYADAASRGAFASLLVGRPTQAQVETATDKWSEALGDSFACGVPSRNVINAGLAGALEIGAMNAASSRGGAHEVREGVGRYVVTLASLALQHRDKPSESRCDALASWAPRTAEAGRDAVERARRNGLMDENYGLLMGLIAH
ncbi:MAG TPA: hypothetical protein VG943_11420 [Caulobacterales bacterium]|nr:hypothetical protein [Caulobacterales bacterium]